jgi:hypothetical protein
VNNPSSIFKPSARSLSVAALLILLGPLQVAAQAVDPTRPPPEVLQNESPDLVEASAPPRVQSIMIGSTKKYAVIDGVAVKEGDRFQQMRVTRINAQSVTLRGDSGPVTLQLNPSVTKTVRPAGGKVTNAAPSKPNTPSTNYQPRRNP